MQQTPRRIFLTTPHPSPPPQGEGKGVVISTHSLPFFIIRVPLQIWNFGGTTIQGGRVPASSYKIDAAYR